MSECDRVLLHRALRLTKDVYFYVSELLAGLPEGEVAVREVAEDVLRLLKSPRDVYLSYYPVTPYHVLGVHMADTIVFVPRARPLRALGKVTFIVLYEPCRFLSDAELRYVLVHELAHASTHREELSPTLLADVLVIHFPEYFAELWEVRQRGAREVHFEELRAWAEERPERFARDLLACSVRLRPVRL